MGKILSYIISILPLLLFNTTTVVAQDTITFPLKIRAGIEASGPISYFTNKNILNAEAFIITDLNEKHALYLGAGILNYKYSQLNYDYLNKGFFIRTGIDFNLFAADKSQGKYWAGFGLHYGLAHYSSQVPFLNLENYWGTETSSIPKFTSWAHFIEATPGVKAELFKYLSVGWSISLRLLVYSGAKQEFKPLYIPGFGTSTKIFSPGLNYYISFNIPYKKIKVIPKPPAPEEPEEPETPPTGTNIQTNP